MGSDGERDPLALPTKRRQRDVSPNALDKNDLALFHRGRADGGLVAVSARANALVEQTTWRRGLSERSRAKRPVWGASFFNAVP